MRLEMLVTTLILNWGIMAAGAKVPNKEAVASCTFSDLPGAVKHLVKEDLAAWTCNGYPNMVWDSGEVIITASCNSQHELDNKCVLARPEQKIGQCPPINSRPTNATLKYQFQHKLDLGHEQEQVYGEYYECLGDLKWKSNFGFRGRLTQCYAGKWTPVYDVCEEGKVARGCL
ncbi:hypothetical protein Hamer_G024528 [Homarus americanus]|uniref:Uncharacterized protein n=1 Tax=Homarus americanus TaxID=6706 RepID=A0A8J5MLL3_HOMAM|nr:hypothetical protein Hamer_G024528 [Homarus americanus]